MSSLKKRSLLVLFIVAALCLAVLIPVLAVNGSSNNRGKALPVPPAAEVSFSLNGADYPLFPVLQDFIDHGWKLRGAVSVGSNAATGISVNTGYRLVNGEYEIYAYLNRYDCISGLEPGECRVKRLNFGAECVESVCVNGKELAGMDRERLMDVLGEPVSTDELEYKATYGYALSGKNISDLSFEFPYSSDTVYIDIVFATEYESEVSFSLNGADYPLFPILQEFIDRGWKLDKYDELRGYMDDEGVTDLVITGYKLTSEKNRISAYLKVDECRSGLEPGECGLRSLSLYGSSVDSFCLNGIELAQTDREGLTAALGEPDWVESDANGETCCYYLPEKGIDTISFAFPYSSETVQQILITFAKDG